MEDKRNYIVISLISSILLLLLIYPFNISGQNTCDDCICTYSDICPVQLDYNQTIIFTSDTVCLNACIVNFEIGCNVNESFVGIITLDHYAYMDTVPPIVFKVISEMPTNNININYYNTTFNIYYLQSQSDFISSKITCRSIGGCSISYNMSVDIIMNVLNTR